MKFKFLFIISVMLTFGCGKQDSNSSSASAQWISFNTKATNSLMAKYNVSFASEPAKSNFIGTWTENVYDDSAETPIEIIISIGGNALVKRGGKTFQERLFKNSKGEYFISDTEKEEMYIIYTTDGKSMGLLETKNARAFYKDLNKKEDLKL